MDPKQFENILKQLLEVIKDNDDEQIIRTPNPTQEEENRVGGNIADLEILKSVGKKNIVNEIKKKTDLKKMKKYK